MFALRAACLRRPLNILQLRQVHGYAADKAPAVTLSSSGATSEDAKPNKWTANSIRTGLIARKRGMTVVWNDQGVRVPVTILQASIGCFY